MLNAVLDFTQNMANVVTHSYNAYAKPTLSERPYANDIIQSALFATSPAWSAASHFYRISQTGMYLGNITVALADTAVRGYVLPMVTRAGVEMISHSVGCNPDMLDIPAQTATQMLYTRAKTYSLNMQDVNGNTELMLAAAQGNLQKVYAYIQAGALLNLQNDEGYTALALASKYGHMDIVNIFIQAGAMIDLPNMHGETAFHHAARNNHADILNVVAVHAKPTSENYYNELILAVRKGHAQTVQALIKKGAMFFIKKRMGGQALIEATKSNFSETASVLIEAGVPLDLQDTRGNTPLIYAIINDNINIAGALIYNGANFMGANYEGSTALSLLLSKKHESASQEIIEIIKKRQSINYTKNAIKQKVKKYTNSISEERIDLYVEAEDYFTTEPLTFHTFPPSRYKHDLSQSSNAVYRTNSNAGNQITENRLSHSCSDVYQLVTGYDNTVRKKPF